jgi:hypothetical protein
LVTVDSIPLPVIFWPSGPAVPGLADALTSRELEVLVVTLDIVKKHVRTSWANSARPTAPRMSPAHASSA